VPFPSAVAIIDSKRPSRSRENLSSHQFSPLPSISIVGLFLFSVPVRSRDESRLIKRDENKESGEA
jgi:hypothetical protein